MRIIHAHRNLVTWSVFVGCLTHAPLVDAAQRADLPTKTGAVFVVDDWNNKVTRTDLGSNAFAGNTGAAETALGITTLRLSSESHGAPGNSLELSFDFTDQPVDAFAGYFASLFGMTDTFVSLDGTGMKPAVTTRFPGYFLDTRDLFRGFSSLPGRSIEALRFDVVLETPDAVILKIELKDEAGFDVFTRRTIGPNGGSWSAASLALPADFTDSNAGKGNPASFDWHRVSTFTLIVEREHTQAGVSNPDAGRLLIDNLELVDADGEYPDLTAASDGADGLAAPYRNAFLDFVRELSALYFRDFASTDPRTGGIVQDRSTFADLMTVGGVGFQLTAYVISSERGYLSRSDAAERTRNVLHALAQNPQGPERVGTNGHQGFFYHFQGIDGLRKQNFDFPETPVNEAENTVELSVIDTALAVAAALTAARYFDANDPLEAEIRDLAETLYARVNWRFMLNQATQQFYLGWKPHEARDDSGPFGRFLFRDLTNDPNDFGLYASKLAGTDEQPATLDFYTDEGLLVALLAIAAPNPAHRVDDEVFFSMVRETQGGPFVKTYPGALFTYQFAGIWLDTAALGADQDPAGVAPRVNYFDNTRAAIEATIAYVLANPNGRATWQGTGALAGWGLSATEGPFDDYSAEAAPPAAIAEHGGCPGVGPIAVEAEAGSGAGTIMPRGAASGMHTALIKVGETHVIGFDVADAAEYALVVTYSNDNFGLLETVTVTLNGTMLGEFQAEDTGDGGFGWNVFVTSEMIGSRALAPGTHQFAITVSGGDGRGVEIDVLALESSATERPLEVGTTTVYGVASSIVYLPDESVDALWRSVALGLVHPRFGVADAYNLDIADAIVPGCVDPADPRILRATGPWANFTGFAIDHGPLVAAIDNYLAGNFVPRLFMSDPRIEDALQRLFPDYQPPVVTVTPTATRTLTPTQTPTPTPSASPTSTPTRTYTPTPTGTPSPMSTPTRTATPTGALTLTPTVTATRTPTPTPTMTSGGRTLAQCQHAIFTRSARFVETKLGMLGRCANAIFACIQTKPEARQRRDECVAKAARRCSVLLAASNDAASALRNGIVESCGQSVGGAAMRSASGLGYDALLSACGGNLSTVADIAGCVEATHACVAETVLEAEQPRAKELMRISGLPTASLDALTCLHDHGGNGDDVDDEKGLGRAVDQCQAAIRKAGASALARNFAHTSNCVQRVLRCVVVPNGTDCFERAQLACDRAFAKVADARPRFDATFDRKCRDDLLPYAALRATDGTNFDALAAGCAAIGVPTLATYADHKECVFRRHRCAAEQLLRFSAPRASELLAMVGRDFSGGACP